MTLGPSGKCGRPKGKLLHTIMSLDDQYVTDIVTDSSTAYDALRYSQEADLLRAQRPK